MDVGDFKIKWIDREREPQCPPDPAHPHGIVVDLRQGNVKRACAADLPYPAKRCGYYAVSCNRCKCVTIITTAGRPDDPRRVILPCKRGGDDA